MDGTNGGYADVSGGSFNYAYSRVQDFAEELERRIERNDSGDCAPGLDGNVIDELTTLAAHARALAVKMRAAEWLYSHDIGEETFMRWIGK